MILKNNRAKQGLTTKPVAISFDFLKALFNVELKFKEKATYTINKASRPRQLYHVTHSDMALATILHVVCNTQGHIRNITPHMIYQKIEELYEDPISSSQFYESLEKFRIHNLITIKESEGIYHIQLNGFWNEEKGKASRFVLFHPVVFTKAFTQLSISHNVRSQLRCRFIGQRH